MEKVTRLDESKSRKGWWALGGVFALLLMVVIWRYFLDDVKMPTPALYGVKLRLDKDRGKPLEIFARETAVLRQAMKDDWESRYKDNARFAAFEPGTEESLRKHVEGHREVLTQFWRMADNAPRPLSYPSEIEDYQTGCTFALQDAFLLVRRHITLLTLTGRKDEAMSEASALADFAGRICATNVTTVTWLTAAAAQMSAYNGLREALNDAVLNEAAIAILINRLKGTEVKPTDLSQVLRRSGLAQSGYFRRWKVTGKIDPGYMMEMSKLEMSLFKPNESSWEALRLMLPVAKGLDAGWKSGWRASEDLQFRATAMGHPDHLWDQIRPNRPGRRLAAHLQSSDQFAVRKALQCVAICRSLQVALALRSFELKTGSLPEFADALIPEFLTSLPDDPIAGWTMRWNSQAGQIYSVGMNGRDDGGQFGSEQSMSGDKDWGIVYPWWNKEQEK